MCAKVSVNASVEYEEITLRSSAFLTQVKPSMLGTRQDRLCPPPTTPTPRVFDQHKLWVLKYLELSSEKVWRTLCWSASFSEPSSQQPISSTPPCFLREGLCNANSMLLLVQFFFFFTERPDTWNVGKSESLLHSKPNPAIIVFFWTAKSLICVSKPENSANYEVVVTHLNVGFSWFSRGGWGGVGRVSESFRWPYSAFVSKVQK